jgi:hypothetical protein
MVTQFNTGAPAVSGSTGAQTGSKGSNTIWILLGLAVAGFLVYRYVIKPAQEKKAQASQKEEEVVTSED